MPVDTIEGGRYAYPQWVPDATGFYYQWLPTDPAIPAEVLPGKAVCEIKHSGFTKASGVRELMTHAPFKGRKPFFIGPHKTP